MKTSLFILLSILFIWIQVITAQTASSSLGRYVRTELEKKEDISSFTVSLDRGTDSIPVLYFQQRTSRLYHFVRMYEPLTEPSAKQSSDSAQAPVIHTGALLQGERTIQTEILQEKPLDNAEITINGIHYITDASGRLYDVRQQLLQWFDDLSISTLPLHIQHDLFGAQDIVVTRALLRKTASTEESPLDSTIPECTNDLLQAFGLDFSQLRYPRSEGLDFSVSCPDTVSDGDSIVLTVTAANRGSGAIGSVFVRTFSRESWLNGKLFYFGNIQPGQSISFKRILSVPNAKHAEASYVTFCIWELLGSQPRLNQTVRISRTPTKQP